MILYLAMALPGAILYRDNRVVENETGDHQYIPEKWFWRMG
jgi:hypothetical protein